MVAYQQHKFYINPKSATPFGRRCGTLRNIFTPKKMSQTTIKLNYGEMTQILHKAETQLTYVINNNLIIPLPNNKQ